MNSRELLLKAYELYQNGEYEKGLELMDIDETDEGYPEEEDQFYNLKMCFAALSGKDQQALSLFEQAVGKGLWWMEAYLHSDPDLKSLQGQPRFERLVEICDQRHRQALEEARPELMILKPEEGAEQPYPLVFAIHGRSQNAESFRKYWAGLTARGWLVALPQSSQVAGAKNFIWDDDPTAIAELHHHLKTVLEQYPVDRQRIVLAGFSQGGGLAARMALSPDFPGKKFLLVCPWMPDLEKLPASSAQAAGGARSYFILGGRDDSGEVARQIQKRVDDIGVPNRVEMHPEMGHDFPEDLEASLKQALDFLLSGEPEA